MTDVLLKGVPEEDWRRFKAEAVEHDMKMPEFLSYVLREHAARKRQKATRLNEILSWRSGRSKAELTKLEAELHKLRHSFELKR